MFYYNQHTLCGIVRKIDSVVIEPDKSMTVLFRLQYHGKQEDFQLCVANTKFIPCASRIRCGDSVIVMSYIGWKTGKISTTNAFMASKMFPLDNTWDSRPVIMGWHDRTDKAEVVETNKNYTIEPEEPNIL